MRNRPRSGIGKTEPPRSRAAAGTPGLALPADLDRALRYLDDGQLDTLLHAVSAEARRRGRQPLDGGTPDSGQKEKKASARSTRSGAATKRQPAPVTPGQERLIRAAFESGLTPAAIAREFRLSRAQVNLAIAGPKGRS